MTKHLSDAQLLLLSDGEPCTPDELAHLCQCRECQQRQAELELALANVSGQLRQPVAELQPQAEATAKLAARMPSSRRPQLVAGFVLAAAAGLLVAIVAASPWQRAGSEVAGLPNPSLTPGASRLMPLANLCQSEGPQAQISAALAGRVFARYQLPTPQPGSIEVDYLVPPELGGEPKEENLWPQTYEAGVWNARIKDALEDRLRAMVCSGKLSLQEAQQELAADWIAAYKKHFQTEQPLMHHVAFQKDQPWQ